MGGWTVPLLTSLLAACSITSTSTIQTPGDATALAACPTFSGDVVIQPGAAAAGTIDLSGIQEWDGNLNYENDNTVQTIRAPQLQSIGDITFSNLTELATIEMTSLGKVGNLDFEGLNLASLGFGQQGVTEADTIRIVNTNINDLTGLTNLAMANGILISDNQFLGEIKLGLKMIRSGIEIDANTRNSGGQSISFPDLLTAGQIILRNASSIDIPKLSSVSGTLGLYGNTVQSFAFRNMTYVGALVINDNSNLDNITFSQLTPFNGTNSTLQIANTTKLEAIRGFPQLGLVPGNVYLFGNFSE